MSSSIYMVSPFFKVIVLSISTSIMATSAFAAQQDTHKTVVHHSKQPVA